MSKYTTQLRFPIEQWLTDLKVDNKEDNWKLIYSKLGLSDYPIFDELYRETLNNKIIRRYYMREIGQETVGQFTFMLRRNMHEIMPYYNQLYKSENLVTDPLLSHNMDYSEQWTRDETIIDDIDTTDKSTSNATNNSTSNSTSNSDSRNVFQDTPMNQLKSGGIKDLDYATNVTYDENDVTSNSSTNSTNVNETSSVGTNDKKQVGDYDGTKKHNEKGYDGSQSDLLLTYRKTFINIDLMIVEELSPLFFGLWQEEIWQ